MFSQMERLNIINVSNCQCQWVLYEADVEMVRSPWGSLGSNVSEREKRSRRASVCNAYLTGFQSTWWWVPERRAPIVRILLWEGVASSLIPALCSVIGGSLPWKSMALAWKLRWILMSGGSIISVLNSKFVLLFFNQLIISFYF